MEDQDRQRLAAAEQGLASVTARLNALAEGNLGLTAAGFRLGSIRIYEDVAGILRSSGKFACYYGTAAERNASTDYKEGVFWWTSDTEDLYAGSGSAWQMVGGASGASPGTHKDSHDPHDGSDKLDTANAAEISVVVAAGTGTSHSFARADHVHAIVHAITDNHLATIDGTSNAPANLDYAKWTTLGLEGRTYAQLKTDIGLDAAAVAAVEAAGLALAATKIYSSADGDTTHFLGRAWVGYRGDAGDYAGFGHRDMRDSGGFALMQSAAGLTWLNCETGQTLRFKVHGTDKAYFDAGTFTCPTPIVIDSTPANDTCSGIAATLTAGAALTRGDLVYYGADGKMEKAIATAEATSRVAAIVESATIAEDATGTFLLQGYFEKEWNFGTVGAKIYLSDTSAGAHDETAPADTDECVVVIGIAVAADCLDFRPSFQAIVEHV